MLINNISEKINKFLKFFVFWEYFIKKINVKEFDKKNKE